MHIDSKLQDEGGKILEKDGILYNCALTVCDQGRNLNEYGSRTNIFFFYNFNVVTNRMFKMV